MKSHFKAGLAFCLTCILAFAPLMANADSYTDGKIEKGYGCPSGKCPGYISVANAVGVQVLIMELQVSRGAEPSELSMHDVSRIKDFYEVTTHKYMVLYKSGFAINVTREVWEALKEAKNRESMFCRPGSPCDLRKKESQGVDHGVKKYGREHCSISPIQAPGSMKELKAALAQVNRQFVELEQRIAALEASRQIYYRGKKLCDPNDPNKCLPLKNVPYYWESEIEPAQSGLWPNYSPPSKHKYIGGSPGTRTWLYETPYDADIGKMPKGAGTRLGDIDASTLWWYH